MSKQEKLELLQFAIDWQKRNNKKLSTKFLATYTELAEDEIQKNIST